MTTGIFVGQAKPTAAELCECAGVSRNALYRYHRDILNDLHKLQENIRRDKSNIPYQKLRHLNAENRFLKRNIAELAALVDHYFAAWQECNTIAQRRDRELADLRSKVEKRVTLL